MNKSIAQCVIGLLLTLGTASPSIAVAGRSENPFQKMERNEKYYLSPGSLSMDDKKLYVSFNDAIYPIKGVSVDERGVYVQANDLADSKLFARCPDGHINPPWNLVCQVCGKNLY